MKKFGFIIGIVLVAAILVAVGYWLGFGQRFMADAYAIPVVDKHVTEAAKTLVLLEAIDSGRLDDAKHSLRLELDGQILTVDALLDSADDRSRELARDDRKQWGSTEAVGRSSGGQI